MKSISMTLLLFFAVLPFSTHALDMVFKRFDIAYSEIVMENIQDNYTIVQLHLQTEELEKKVEVFTKHSKIKSKTLPLIGCCIGFFIASSF